MAEVVNCWEIASNCGCMVSSSSGGLVFLLGKCKTSLPHLEINGHYHSANFMRGLMLIFLLTTFISLHHNGFVVSISWKQFNPPVSSQKLKFADLTIAAFS
jgi:hypothetical protein